MALPVRLSARAPTSQLVACSPSCSTAAAPRVPPCRARAAGAGSSRWGQQQQQQQQHHAWLQLQPVAGPCARLPRAAAPAHAPRRQRVLAAALQPPAAAEGAPVRRRLILLRHADSEQGSGVRDHDRPISEQGVEESLRISSRLRDMGWMPDLIIASNSKRTKQTLDAMTEAEQQLGEADAHYLGSLYTVAALDGQTRQHIEECIRSLAGDAAHRCIMCVGHNKGWEEAACSWARGAVRLNTACAALFEAAGCSWEEVLTSEAEWKLVDVVTP